MKLFNILAVWNRYIFSSRAICSLFTAAFVSVFALLPAYSQEESAKITAIEQKEARKIIKQAEKLMRRGDLVEAEKILRPVVDKDKSNETATLLLSRICLKSRKLIEAYDLSFRVAKANGKNGNAFALLGMTMLASGNLRQARLLLNSALQLNNKSAMAWAGFGMLDFYENRIDDAIYNLREATDIDPNEPDFIFALAQVYSRSEKYRLAADAYNRFLRIAPQSDEERRERIKGLITFLKYLGNKSELYIVDNDIRQTTIPFNLVRDRPIVETRVNGKDQPLRFVLDTGSGISVISQETAERLNIEPVSTGGMARAVGGTGKFQIIYGFVRSIKLGDIRIKNVPVYIRKFSEEGEKIDGYIGLSLISKFLTTVDYGNNSFNLLRRTQRAGDKIESEGLALPLRLTSSGFLSGEVKLGGIEAPFNFIVDTGASISVISDDLASMGEISKFSTPERVRVIGAAGITENVPSFMLPRLTFGKHSRESIKAIALDLDIINEAAGFEQAGILGGNFLKNYSLTFDFQNSRVTFVPVKNQDD